MLDKGGKATFGASNAGGVVAEFQNGDVNQITLATGTLASPGGPELKLRSLTADPAARSNVPSAKADATHQCSQAAALRASLLIPRSSPGSCLTAFSPIRPASTSHRPPMCSGNQLIHAQHGAARAPTRPTTAAPLAVVTWTCSVSRAAYPLGVRRRDACRCGSSPAVASRRRPDRLLRRTYSEGPVWETMPKPLALTVVFATKDGSLAPL